MVRPILFLALSVAGCAGGPTVVGGPFPLDPANMTYPLDGENVELKNGTHEVKTGESADDFVRTDLTKARSDADFDGDSATDSAVVVTKDDGKLAVHYLAVITNAGKVTTITLGKNVLVQELAPHPKGGIEVKLLGRDDGVPEDTPPTLPLTKRYELKAGALVLSK
ncbi:MAG: hypothetical protein HOV80_20080 [Polyangiaceae bacterium]|nr:hypothetical protein [Polyangiaceae bacterium]